MLLLSVLLIGIPTAAHCNNDGNHPILIISSYNPDSRNTSQNISDFVEEFESLGGSTSVVLENMNCKSFSEARLWKGRMEELLKKYQGDLTPSLIVLIGQEAWTAYLSQDSQHDIPVMVALASRNAIILPSDSINLRTWMPESIDAFDDLPSHNIKSGFVYEYDVTANINLILSLYPDTRNIAFVSDNTYGGVALQTHVREEMKQFPDLNLILLDGRNNTIYNIIDKIRQLPPHTALLIGTWRVDMNDGYFMKNATYMMMEASTQLPSFSITSVGIGYWAIGGIMPKYRLVGREMAQQAIKWLNTPQHVNADIEVIANRLVIDDQQVKERKINLDALADREVEYINKTLSFYELYTKEIWTFSSLFILLLTGLIVALSFYYHTKKMKNKLEVSESQLRVAKEEAEESNRLKSAFLANMSHEIRTPLNAIVGFSDVLAFGEISEEEKQGYAKIIKINSDMLLRLIGDILDMSRLESGNVKFEYQSCDVVQLCMQTLASVEQGTNIKNNRFAFVCDMESFVMTVDPQRLQQVIINLLTNANKFTENGNITLSLEVDQASQVARFAISDTGCGIPPEKQHLIFGRFEKLNEFAQGTGLGLSICKLTVAKWKGEIWIDSDYTDGARFIFTHPLNNLPDE
ncbi:MAG: HAMP domain-containing histidine kinase [Prevotellaceae bacterium]|jgi:signal transduction histidine kinase|nr:HAMP domain-containing histidine kinase [Prevotellaceae bacterium]